MSKTTPNRLDRLFARSGRRAVSPGPRDAWDPAWQPRGRWWMRAEHAWGDARLFAADRLLLHRLARPARAA